MIPTRAILNPRFLRILLPSLLLFLGLGLEGTAQLLITEFMAVNSIGIEDEDGDRSDWIEIYNPGSESVNLGGWHLTDKVDDLTRWACPPVILTPGAYRIVWASNKNRKDPDEELHTNFKLSGDGEYLALVEPDGVTIAFEFRPQYPEQVDDVSFGSPMGSGSLSTAVVISANAPARALAPTDDALDYDNLTGQIPWTLTGLDDTSWASGHTGVGYERNSGYQTLINLDVESMMYGKRENIYARVPFEVPGEVIVNSALLRMRYDDGFRAYLNGESVAEANIDGTGWDASVDGSTTDSTNYSSYPISSVGNLVAGTNTLALHGVNNGTTSSDLLLLPELTIYYSATPAPPTNPPQYFPVPTPGRANMGGVDNIGPQFSEEGHLPRLPTETQDLVVTVRVVDDDGVSSITMTYEIMFDGEVTVAMYDDGSHGDGAAGDGVYGATIPSSTYAAGEMVRYRFNAVDGAGYASRWPLHYDPLNSPDFFGTMAQVAVTSSMRVFHWFIDTHAYDPDVRTESRSSLFYNGVLYDNIMTRVRGKSTSSAPKPNHKFDFNRGHHFEYDPAERKVEEMNLNTTYTDKTYFRRLLSWKTYEEAGAPGCRSFLVHLRRNNQFYGVQTFEEQIDEDFLIRHGYDPNGAMYKMMGATSSTDHAHKKTRRWDMDRSDIEGLIDGINGPDHESFLFDNVDLANFINYLAISSVIRDGDNANKNHYYYRDTDGTGDWSIFGWDKDLTFGMNWRSGVTIYHDDLHTGGALLFPSWSYMVDAFEDSADLRALYMRRLRTVADQTIQAGPGGFYDGVISNLLAAHTIDLTEDYNTWGNPWTFGDSDKRYYTPADANQGQTIDFFLDHGGDGLASRRANIYGNGELPAAQVGWPSVEISHVEVVPASGNQAEEYIQLFNLSYDDVVDISGWSLSNAVTHVLAPGSVVLPRKHFYVSPDTGAFRRRATSPKGGEKLFVQGNYRGMLSSRGETLTLHDPTGTLRDSVSWAADLTDAQRYLRVSEVMYHPALPPASDLTEDRLEFVELKNIGPSSLDVAGTFFTSGIVFTNPAVVLPAGGYLVVASDPAEFARQYDTNGMMVVGPFNGYLSNGNDELELEDSRGETIQRFGYNDDWHPNTDGDGFSLTLVDPGNTNLSVWGEKASWRPSRNLGGSPGTDDADLLPGTLVINEVLAHSDTGDDWIEILNTSAGAVSVGSWFLSDSGKEPKKYRLPAGTVIPAGGFLVVHEASFNHAGDPDTLTPFALSELGDSVVLSSAEPDGTLLGFRASGDFGASDQDVPFGVHRTSEDKAEFVAMHAATMGTANSAPRVGPVVVSEIMYHPAPGGDEFLELYNSGAEDIPLYHPGAPTNTWQVDGAVEYAFPTGESLDAGARLLVVGTNPAAFRAAYAIPAEVEVYGAWNGNLANEGESILLKKPGDPEPDGFAPYILVEEVDYHDRAPWPTAADGTGPSLQRVSSEAFGDDPAAWGIGPSPSSPGYGPLADDNDDGLPDDYQVAYFGGTGMPRSGPRDDFDFDGLDNGTEYVLGSSATNASPPWALAMDRSGGVPVIYLPTTRTSGPGYFGLQRYYLLEETDGPGDWTWIPMEEPGCIAADGTVQPITLPGDETGSVVRARVWLK